jgi:D-alanyl-D-alanine carboxypeptidase
LGLAAVVALLALTNDPADARHRRKHSHARAASSSYDPPYAAIVVDAKNGAVLHQANPDAPRHPASLTKVMTLYLLFERLEAGKISLDTQMPVSEEAARQAPTKLGLKPGSTLKVEDAIKGLVTKSANDAAMVIAEALAGGDDDEFARMMTRKARALGMRNTTYRNPNGLPNDEQVTTARDQALLGIAIQERFPKFYRYFSLPSFVYHGRSIRNHNHLLGSVDGVDGIKTGYTRDSGFNLVTSVRRGARHIVAVVMGGRSASSRDARMRGLIEENIAQASTKPAIVQVAEASRAEAPPVQAKSQIAEQAAPIPPRANEVTAAVTPGSKAPITPVKVKTVTVKLVPPKNAPTAKPEPKPEPMPSVAVAQAATSDEALAETLAAAAPIDPPAPPAAAPAPAHPGVLGKLPAMISAAKDVAVPAAKADEIPTHHTTRGGWAIQIGAYEDEGEAKQKLTTAKDKVSQVLKKAEAYIERTVKGATTYYRARFAGLDRDQAETACKRLKRQDVACMALKI